LLKRGEILRLRGPRRSSGREQDGPRYCVVVQADALLSLSTVIVAPTSTRAAPASFRPEIRIGDRWTRVMTDHMRAVDPGGLGESEGLVTHADMSEIDRALLTVLGLNC
jgi:mRNA interferase MazF